METSNKPTHRAGGAAPTHRAYAVFGEGQRTRWREIGALWGHKDGKGYSLKLDLIPVTGADIVIRVNEPKAVNDDISWTEEGGTQ